jgi:hypothetical protein
MKNKAITKTKEAKTEVAKVEAVKIKEAEAQASAEPVAEKPLTLIDLQKELEALRQTVQDHTQLIADLQSMLALKKKPALNSKIQIKDKGTSKVYPSKNNCYQSLLKSGELKELVDQGIFGSNLEKNNFGWFALVRAWPDRFEEVKPEAGEATVKEASGTEKSSSVPDNK